MTRENNEEPNTGNKQLPNTAAGAKQPNQRHEPRFDSFNDDDEYEEPERDIDSASGYRSDHEIDDADFEDDFSEEEDDDDDYDDEVDAELPAEDQPEDWLDEDDNTEEEVKQSSPLPFGLIAVAVIALVLLVAGGYGVMQERETTQEELRQLRATLATTSSQGDTGAGHEALANMKQSYDKLAADAEALTLENRRLTDTIAGLQAQLGAQQDILTQSTPSKSDQTDNTSEKTVAALYGKGEKPAAATPAKPVAVEKAAPPKPAAPEPVVPASTATKPPAVAAPAVSGDWFVNFGSYTSRTVAESWSAKLRPVSGRVIVAQSVKDGTTFYRVRVIGLGSKSTAEEVARKLEAELKVGRLWIGKE